MNAELLLDAQADLAEAPFWDDREKRLYWVDIDAGKVHRTAADGSQDFAVSLGEKVGTAVVREKGGLLVAAERGFAFADPASGALERIADPEPDNPDTRFNDGKCDPAGRFWAGSMSKSRITGSASLYRLDPDLALTKRVEGVTVSNGMAWDLSRERMYYIDTPTKSVVAFVYDPASGEISSPSIAFRTPEALGSPDGMTIDDEGMLWIAFFRGGCVARWNPETGRLVGKVDIPAPNVTSCCFGGADLKTLYVTTARQKMDQESLDRYPQAGGIFSFDAGVSGSPSYRFKG